MTSNNNLHNLAADVEISRNTLAGPDYQAFSKHLKLLDDLDISINSSHNKGSCADCYGAPVLQSLKENQKGRQKLLVRFQTLRKLLDDMERMVELFTTDKAFLEGAKLTLKLREFGQLTTAFNKNRKQCISNLASLVDDVWLVPTGARRKFRTNERGEYEPDKAEVWMRQELETRAFMDEVAFKVLEMKKITALPLYKNPEYQLFFDEVNNYQQRNGGRFPRRRECIHGAIANTRLENALQNMVSIYDEVKDLLNTIQCAPGAIESEILEPRMLDGQIRVKFNNKVDEIR